MAMKCPLGSVNGQLYVSTWGMDTRSLVVRSDLQHWNILDKFALKLFHFRRRNAEIASLLCVVRVSLIGKQINFDAAAGLLFHRYSFSLTKGGPWPSSMPRYFRVS